VTAVSSEGFDFVGDHFHTIDNPTSPTLVSNGTPIYLLSEAESDLGRPITMTQAGGGTFSLLQFDGAETFVTGGIFQFINLVGVQADATVLNLQFALDGVKDGVGGIADFQTFLVGWTNLQSVTFSGALATGGLGGFSIDNIVVDQVAVPEPATLLLLAGGLGAAAARRRARRSRNS
jgi:hypothetical protein